MLTCPLVLDIKDDQTLNNGHHGGNGRLGKSCKLSSGRKFTAFFSVLLPKEGLHFWGHLSECIVYIDYKFQALGVGEKLNSERLY